MPGECGAAGLSQAKMAAEARSGGVARQLRKELHETFADSGLTMQRAFRVFDKDGNGTIDKFEMKVALTAVRSILFAHGCTRHAKSTMIRGNFRYFDV